MNPNLSALYVAILKNRVVVFESNLSAFWKLFRKIEPKCKGYDHYNDKFKETDVIKYVNDKDEVYILQKLM